MIRLSTFVSTMFIILSFSAQAEIAVVCGDLQAIENDEDKAVVHADFDSESISSKEEVKFLSQYGVDQEVISAQTLSNGVIMVKTPQSSFAFKNMEDCENEGRVSVEINAKERFSCNCYSD